MVRAAMMRLCCSRYSISSTRLCLLRVLEVYGHDGKATNGEFHVVYAYLHLTTFVLLTDPMSYLIVVVATVTMEPGDMVLYESHSVIHGK